MEKRIRGFARKSIVGKYLLFVAGIQVAVAVNLFTNIWFVTLSPRGFILVLLAGLALGVSSFISLVLAGEVEYIVKTGEAVVETPLERDRIREMDEALDERIPISLIGPRKRIHIIGALFWSDIGLTVLALAMITLGRTWRSV